MNGAPGKEEEAAEQKGGKDEGSDKVARAGGGLGGEDGHIHLGTHVQ